MKTKLVFSTKTLRTEEWTVLPFVPRINELLNVQDILKSEEVEYLKSSAQSWSGAQGKIQSVEYRHDDNDFYTEINILCED